jgi:hypothetical protein
LTLPSPSLGHTLPIFAEGDADCMRGIWEP